MAEGVNGWRLLGEDEVLPRQEVSLPLRLRRPAWLGEGWELHGWAGPGGVRVLVQEPDPGVMSCHPGHWLAASWEGLRAAHEAPGGWGTARDDGDLSGGLEQALRRLLPAEAVAHAD